MKMVSVYVYIYIYIYVCVCVCVCNVGSLQLLAYFHNCSAWEGKVASAESFQQLYGMFMKH